MTDLRVDWCSYKAAKFAVMNWHYSRALPAGKLAKLGVWENGRFIGAILFGLGANNNIGKPYKLQSTQACELVRVAMREHQSAVSKVVSVAVHKLRSQSRGLRLIVSYADPRQSHVGTIYQAMNWIYVGKSDNWKGSHYVVTIDGNDVEMHGRSVRAKWGKDKYIPYSWVFASDRSKHKYLYPLDRAMRRQITPLAQPYPKRETCGQSVTGDTSGFQPGGAGSIPAVRSEQALVE